jgi:hypothetical protein
METRKTIQEIIEVCDSHNFRVEKEVARKHFRYLAQSILISLIITAGGISFIAAVAGILIKILS